MNPHCECPIAGWCNRHQMKKNRGFHERCRGIAPTQDCGRKFWIAFEQGKFGATPPENPILNPAPFCDGQDIQRSTVGTRLEQVIEERTGRKIECDDCRQRVQALNRLSVDEVAQSWTVIVADIEMRISKVANAVERMLVAADRLLHTGITFAVVGEWLNDAIELAKRDEVPQPKKVKPAKVRASRVAVADGGRRFIKSLKAEQDRLYALFLAAPKPKPDPFIGDPVLHFGGHLWPIAGNWEWHADLWNQLARLINGRLFVGVAVDTNTVSFQMVRDRLDPRIECREFANNGEGENQTFRWLQQVVPHGTDDVLIYAHGKGARNHTAQSEAVRRWSEAMYQTVVFNHSAIIQRLSEGYKNFHSFRTFGTRPLSPVHKWHWSGTFFAVRAKYLPRREVKPRYGGVEAWGGDHFQAAESWCEFFDNSMFTTLYDHRESQELVLPRLIEWNRKQRYEVDEMCSTWGRNFARYLPEGSVRGKQVIEIGARDVNGSCRGLIVSQFPSSYVGVDMEAGPNVDIVCTGQELPGRVGIDAADILICTEVLEHVEDWHGFLSAIWSVLRPGGILLLTTRSPGFPYHEYPSDHWRFTVGDMLAIFSGQEILTITSDPTSDPGVGVIVRKTTGSLQHCEPVAMAAP